MTPSLKTRTFPNKLSGDNAGPWSTVFQRNKVSRYFFKFLQQERCSLFRKKTKGLGRMKEHSLCLISPDRDQVKISRALLGLEHQCSNSASPENSEPAEDNLCNIRILLYPQPNWRYAPFSEHVEGQEDLQSPSIYLRVVLPTAVFKKCYHSFFFFLSAIILSSFSTFTILIIPSALSARKKNGFEQHKPMFTAPILNSNLNAANLNFY